jgi:adenylate cyclase
MPLRFGRSITAEYGTSNHCPDSFGLWIRQLAAALAGLGREAEASETAAHLLQLKPNSRISKWMAPGGRSQAQVFIDGLRKAGLPE